MPASPQFCVPDDRFRTYREELCLFLASYSVAHGRPEDLVTLFRELGEREAVRKGLGSLIRAVFYREQQEISPDELVRLVAACVGGEGHVYAHEIEQGLLLLVGQALASLWQTSFAEQPMPSVPVLSSSVEPQQTTVVAPRAVGPDPALEPAAPAARSPRAEPAAQIAWEEVASFHVRAMAPAPGRSALSLRRWVPSRTAWPPVPKAVWFGAACAVLVPPGIDWLARQHTAATLPPVAHHVHRSAIAYAPLAVPLPVPWSPGLHKDPEDISAMAPAPASDAGGNEAAAKTAQAPASH